MGAVRDDAYRVSSSLEVGDVDLGGRLRAFRGGVGYGSSSSSRCLARHHEVIGISLVRGDCWGGAREEVGK